MRIVRIDVRIREAITNYWPISRPGFSNNDLPFSAEYRGTAGRRVIGLIKRYELAQ